MNNAGLKTLGSQGPLIIAPTVTLYIFFKLGCINASSSFLRKRRKLSSLTGLGNSRNLLDNDY